MSFLAIGSVTRAIYELLSKKMNKPPLMGDSVFKVTTLPPDDERVDDANGVNLFLYRVVVNPFLSNVEWRGDKANANGSKRPPLALNLHYMLTAYAKKGDGASQDDITAHQLLGNAMSILHECPVLNDVHDSEFDADVDSQFASELRDSFEKIKISLVPTTMDEFSKIWTGFSKAYRLSVIYDVSLVQIAPRGATSQLAPPVQQTALRVTTIKSPVVASVTPASGAAGAQVSLSGSHFKAAGSATLVTIGDTVLDEGALVRLTAEEIVLNIPESPRAGPKLPLAVKVNGRESAPVFYEVEPWIESLQPLRGIGGVPLSIPFDVPPGAQVRVQIDDMEVAATFDPARKVVNAVVPNSIKTNGLKPVALLVEGATTRRSNARFFELLPVIDSTTVTSTTDPLMTTVVVSGQRLNGKETTVRYGQLLIRKGENSNPAELSVSIARQLEPDAPVAVIIDGRESNTLPPVLESIEPAEAARGATLTLRGKSLSGGSVSVEFGATGVSLGAQPFASRLNVVVPTTLAPGDVQVKVTVNGDDTNKLDFKVLA